MSYKPFYVHSTSYDDYPYITIMLIYFYQQLDCTYLRARPQA